VNSLRHASLALALVSGAVLVAQAPSEPVNPHASPEAKALLKYMYSISGKGILSGQHNYPLTIARWTNRVTDFTGKYPALYGQDFGFQAGEDKDSVLARPAILEEVKRQHRNGAVVTLTWHAVRPTQDEPVGFTDSIQGKLTDYEWKELTTPGTALNQRWVAQIDVIAGYLKELRDAHVPVLWRPYHEVNGSWFWWGGRKGPEGSAKLYRMMFERYTKVHHLDNLVWVWNANAPNGGPGWGPGPYVDFFPGLDVADMVSVDVYDTFKTLYYDEAVKLANGKPVALGEVGPIPSPEVLKAQPKWTYFMTWSEFVEDGNPLEAVKATYADPSVINRDDVRVKKAMEAIRKISVAPVISPVDGEASAATKALLVKLYQSPGFLAGQNNDAAAPGAASAKVQPTVGKAPILFGQELSITKESGVDPVTGLQAILDEVKKQAAVGSIVSLSWKAPRPTEDGTPTEAALQTPLSSYEWSDLLTSGSRLNQRWAAQVDALAVSLKQLQDAGISVLWRPYPKANASTVWYGGRKGVKGSAELYRMVFERLTVQHKLHNLVWVWEAAQNGGATFDFFPGLLCVDALALDGEDGNNAVRSRDFATFGAGKPAGLTFSGKLPEPWAMAQAAKWSWFLTAPAHTPEQLEALKKLYQEPKVAAK